MRSDVAHEAHGESLSRLTSLAPDAARSERLRRACHARLARRVRCRTREAAMIGFAVQVVAPCAIGLVSAVYAVALVATTLRLGGLFW